MATDVFKVVFMLTVSGAMVHELTHQQIHKSHHMRLYYNSSMQL